MDTKIITVDEAAALLDVKKSYLYKLTFRRAIPHYKPCGKKLYFDRDELVAWIKSNRVSTDEELDQEAQKYTMKKGGVK